MSSVIPGFQGLPAFCHIYNTGIQAVLNGATFTFDTNNVLNDFSHTAGSDTITANTSGVFYVSWIINGQSGGAFTFLQNNVRFTPLSYVSAAATEGLMAQGLITINKNDTFKLRNDTGLEVDLVQQNNYSNASIVFMQIGNHG